MRKLKLPRHPGWILLFLCITTKSFAQPTFPVNGVADPRVGCYAFTNATIVKDGQTTIRNGTMVIREGKIVAIGTAPTIPKDAVTVNCNAKYIYPSLIDAYTDYGLPVPQRPPAPGGFFAPQQFSSSTKGAYGWNQAVHPETNAIQLFTIDDGKAKPYRDNGFGTVHTVNKDGIGRGTGAVVSLATEKDNLSVIKSKASANYSFVKGTSTQTYPNSMMGAVALLRQTYLDAQWYKNLSAVNLAKEGVNMSLQAWNDVQSLPQFFETSDKWGDIRADRIGDEFGVQYIIKGGGDEYQRINDIAATHATYIVTLNYPPAQEVDDPNDARFISLADLKHWELAPTNPAAMEKANIPFCISSADMKDSKQFWTNLRKAMENGLTESRAFDAMTKAPATLLGIYDKVGSLEEGKLANFLITTGPLFNEKTSIIENWVQGKKYVVKEGGWSDIKGQYKLVINDGQVNKEFTLDVKSNSSATLIGKDTLNNKFSYDGKMVKISFSPIPSPKKDAKKDTTVKNDKPVETAPGGDATIRLSGVNNGDLWQGIGVDTSGTPLSWSVTFSKASEPEKDTAKKKTPPILGKVIYPFGAYGNAELPKQESILFKNATVWTNENEGRLQNTDVLVKSGKIVQVGKNLSDASARVIDGTGKYLSPGIIDEHSHIAAYSINEGGQSVSSEVRISDNLYPEDIDIYRQLGGGVTAVHILHGSSNTIGGQTQLIKLRWGANDEELKFKGADPFIKFALGENVKRTFSTQGNTRFPDTRMGVEEVLVDAFQRATDYQRKWKDAEDNSKKKGALPSVVRRDLELDALVEIMNKKRFITCHSYVQSEVNAFIHIADRFGFTVNTFTHILEGYKVADKMKAHGANGSTFSDWWAYKVEVQDAIPYNPTLMQRVGVNVCINSDDPEMARRLNQEAAKSVKYGGMSEDDAFKMVTLNPAKALHIDDRVGSIKVGKDADLVLWSDNPLSIYAQALYTMVDGIVYFDRNKDKEMRMQVSTERNRLIQKLINEGKSNPGSTTPAKASLHVVLRCEDDEHQRGLLETNEYETNNSNSR